MPVPLPAPDDATLLPQPDVVVRGLMTAYLAARGASNPQDPPGHERPRLTIADVKTLANVITFALKNDLPTVDAHDAAVIWEKWRKAIVDLRDLMRDVTNADQALIIATVLEHRIWDIEASLATALRDPGEVFSRYCPWRTEWATHERIYPEAG
jgi:hypothetical protein